MTYGEIASIILLIFAIPQILLLFVGWFIMPLIIKDHIDSVLDNKEGEK